MAAAVLESLTSLGKALAGAIVVGGLLSQLAPSVRSVLGLVATRAIPRPWTLLTCAFVHSNIVSAVAFAAAALFLCRIVEPIYGSRELVKFLTVVTVLTSFLTVAVVTVIYYATLSSSSDSKVYHAGDLLFQPMGGFEAGAAALLVAVKQLIPDNEVAMLGGMLKFRAKHLPGLYVVTMLASSFLLGGAMKVIPFTLFGTYLAWAYLRFVQTRNGVRGDLSEEFRLASFFPQPLQPPIDQLAAACTRLTGLGAGGMAAQQQQPAWGYGMGGGALPGSGDGDSQRRRERGAKALEERLGLKKAAAGSRSEPAIAASASAPPPSAAATVGQPPAVQQPEEAEADVEAAAPAEAQV